MKNYEREKKVKPKIRERNIEGRKMREHEDSSIYIITEPVGLVQDRDQG